MSKREKARLAYEWTFWARPNQLAPPGDWRIWLLLAGRGFGKTRTGAEYVKARIRSGKAKRVTLAAPTAANARDIMVEGPSGILAIYPVDERPAYESSKRELTWPEGAIGKIVSADEPDRIRGLNHDTVWADELASWRYGDDAWTQLMLGLRGMEAGGDPRAVVTTTPKPVKAVKDLLGRRDVHVTRGTTYENRDNLPVAFFDDIIRQYEGTRLGRQELMAEVLEDVPGALWTLQQIEALRVAAAPELVRVVVAIDPAATATEESDETGIVVAARGRDGHGYVLADRSLRASPDGWGRKAANAYHDFAADRVVYEANQGGDMVKFTLKTVDPRLPLRSVNASRGKRTRAEPIAALYEQGRVHHVGVHRKLEDQMTSWTPDDPNMASPDRVDALVWALSDLMLSVAVTADAAPDYLADKRGINRDGEDRDDSAVVLDPGGTLSEHGRRSGRRGGVPSLW